MGARPTLKFGLPALSVFLSLCAEEDPTASINCTVTSWIPRLVVRSTTTIRTFAGSDLQPELSQNWGGSHDEHYKRRGAEQHAASVCAKLRP